MIERYEADYAAALQAEQAAIARATADHTSMPQNYWQERWRALQRLRAAQALAEALTDET